MTVAVLAGTPHNIEEPWLQRRPDDYEAQWFGGTTGAGGQHRNKTECAVRLRHVPTGVVRTAQTRSRANSLQMAREALDAELDRLADRARGSAANAVRREQVGTGERSDKRRTYRFQDDRAHDHLTGRSAPCADVMRGRLDLLWSRPLGERG